MRIARSFAFSTAAAAVGLIVAAPAAAADVVVPLKSPHTNTTALNDEMFEQDCDDERFEVRKTYEDGWHFIMPSGSFTSIKVTFDPDGAVDNDPADDVVREGTPSAAGPFTFYTSGNTGNYQHAYLFTPAGWLLVNGTATATGVKAGATFNISHACVGKKDTSTPTPGPDGQPSGDPSGDPSDDPSGTPPAGGGGGLPLTGAATTVVVATGVGLVAGGLGLLMVRRRRDHA